MKNRLNKNYLLGFGIVFFAILLHFPPIFFQGKTLIFGDNFSLMVPGKIYTIEWLKQGILPFWNPHLFGGLPWIGDINQSILYPFTTLFLFLKPATAINWTIIIHLVLTFFGMYRLISLWGKNNFDNKKNIPDMAILGAIFWTFSTQMINALNNITFLQSVAWMPWVIYFGLLIQKKTINKFLFSFFVLLQFLGGYPQHVIFTISTTVVFSIFENIHFFKTRNFIKIRKWLWSWVITAFLTVGLSAFVWLPFWESLLGSTRVIQSSTQAVSGSLHPLEVIKVFLPYFFDNAQQGVRWGPAWNGLPNVVLYIPWIIFLVLGNSLAKFKEDKNIRFLALFSLVTFLLAFGENLPGYSFLQSVVPILKFSRGPSMILVITTFLISIWMALAFSRFKKNKILNFLVVSVLAGISLLLFIKQADFSFLWNFLNDLSSGFLERSQFHTMERDKIILNGVLNNALINSMFFLVSLGVFIFIKNRFKFFLLMILVVADLFYNTQSLTFYGLKETYPNQSVLVSETMKYFLEKNQYRFLIRNYNSPYTEFGTYWEAMAVRKPFSDSFIDQKELESLSVLQKMAVGITPDWNMVAGVHSLNGYTTLLPKDTDEIWNTAENYPDKKVAINSLPEIKLNNPLLQTWSTKYYLVDTWFEVKEDLSNLKIIATQDNWQLYELPGALSRFRYEDDTAIDISDSTNFSENPNSIFLQLDNSDNHSHLIVADRYDKNWKAWVNGNEITIENMSGMRKIPLKNGQNKIELKYVPHLFYWGLIISGITLFSTLSICLLNKTKKLC